jgi:hypothetical protein
MKRSKIFMAAGAFVLAISAMFATKANKKFNSFTTGYIGSGLHIYVGGFSLLTTTRGTVSPFNKTVFVTLYTSSSKIHTQLYASNGRPLYHD